MKKYTKAFVIGDVHGELEKLKRLLDGIDREEYLVILVGDIIDRGPHSRETIEFIRSSGIQAVKGNHEVMSCECIPLVTQLAEGKELTNQFMYKLGDSDWFLNGGKDVFTSYRKDYQALLTDLLYLQSLPLYIETGIKDENNLELLVSHTWSAFKPLKQASTLTFDFVWDRNQPYAKKNNTPYYNVFGHTPTDYVLQKKATIPADVIFYDGSVNIDTGAPYDTPTRGVLSGIFFPSLDVKQIKD